MSHGLGIDVELPLPVHDALRMVRDALKQEGFGVLTEIDLQAAFREKLGREFRPYLILAACNPPLAFSAINADPAVGLLLPCNVALGSSQELESVARDAGSRMARVAETLKRAAAVS